MRAFLLSLLAFAACRSEPPHDPVAEAEGQYVLGSSAFLQGKLSDAERAFLKVRALHPQDKRLPAALGEVYLAERKLPEALREFEAASAQDPGRATNWSRIGTLQLLLGHHPESREALNKALSLSPLDASALEDLGDLELREGRIDAGVARYAQAALARGPQDPSGPELFLQGEEALTRRGRSEEGLALLEQATDAGVTSAALLVELADGRVRKGGLAEAIGLYEEAARLDGTDPTLWEVAGELDLSLGRLDDAERAFQASLKVKERALPHIALARLYRRRKAPDAAKAELEQALQSATGEERRESVELADLLLDWGRKADALKLLSTLAGEPDSAHDAALQLKTARLAKVLKDAPAMAQACARANDAGVKCP